MSRRRLGASGLGVLALLATVAGSTRADEPTAAPVDSMASSEDATSGDDAGEGVVTQAPPARPSKPRPQLEALVPELAEAPYRLAPGPRPFQHRINMSPSYGYLGSEPLYAFRLGYYPDSWLGYEATVAHNPGESVHAVLHTVSAILRRPVAGRWQPYVSGGYGMIMVFPGQSLNASPVTKNALALGGGLEFYIRSDLALRGDVRHATVFGREKDRDGVVAYGYLQETVGLSFYRSVRP